MTTPHAIQTTISHYTLTRKLGAGTYGEVYEAVHQHDDELRVAIKVVTRALVDDARFVEALKRECRQLDKLRHPNIVGFRDLVVEDGRIAMVLELLRGQDLHERLANGPLPVDTAVAVIEAILEGLGHAHARGVLHRDIKPGNVFWCDDGEVKVLDFGIARAADGTQATKTGHMVGTFDYMAPERFTGEGGSPASDVYAVGLMAWELLKGTPACPEGEPGRKMGWHLAQGVGDTGKVAAALPGCPPWLADVIVSLAAKDPAERPADGAAALAMLRAKRAGAAGSASEGAPAGRRPPPATVMGPAPVGSVPPVAASVPPRSVPPPPVSGSASGRSAPPGTVMGPGPVGGSVPPAGTSASSSAASGNVAPVGASVPPRSVSPEPSTSPSGHFTGQSSGPLGTGYSNSATSNPPSSLSDVPTPSPASGRNRYLLWGVAGLAAFALIGWWAYPQTPPRTRPTVNEADLTAMGVTLTSVDASLTVPAECNASVFLTPKGIRLLDEARWLPNLLAAVDAPQATEAVASFTETYARRTVAEAAERKGGLIGEDVLDLDADGSIDISGLHERLSGIRGRDATATRHLGMREAAASEPTLCVYVDAETDFRTVRRTLYTANGASDVSGAGWGRFVFVTQHVQGGWVGLLQDQRVEELTTGLGGLLGSRSGTEHPIEPLSVRVDTGGYRACRTYEGPCGVGATAAEMEPWLKTDRSGFPSEQQAMLYTTDGVPYLRTLEAWALTRKLGYAQTLFAGGPPDTRDGTLDESAGLLAALRDDLQSGAGGLIGAKGTPMGSGNPSASPQPVSATHNMNEATPVAGVVPHGDRIVILGALDGGQINQVVKRNLSSIGACYQAERFGSPSLAGDISIKFVIAKDGTVSSAITKSTTMNNPAVEACINEHFLRFQFPEPKGGGIVFVSYPFSFLPD